MIGMIPLVSGSKMKTTNQNDGFNIGLQSSSSNQEITLVMGSDDNAITTGILAFQENINSNIIVNKKDSILTSDSNDILVIFSHGTEKGMIINDELISWADLSIILSQTNAKLIFLAICYGANIYDFTGNTDKKIIAWSGVSDAILMGYAIALVVNGNFQHLDDAQANLNLLKDRLDQISEHPEQIIPLAYTKIERRIIYGWWGIILVNTMVLHLKFTPWEMSFMGGLQSILNVLYAVLGSLSVINPILILAITLQIININVALQISESHHSSGGAWISFEFYGWPPIGSYIHGYAPSGATAYSFLFLPDPVGSVVLWGIYGEFIHDWTWRGISQP
ncbi:hypothetical protein LCGC14_1358250 [marine sediment metagenome]|uniref:CHAT domain-containing protein n=1 Tax=marine sediment metagenome TaxID=412755 RepID=A0A0F9KUX8_9ZZZZ